MLATHFYIHVGQHGRVFFAQRPLLLYVWIALTPHQLGLFGLMAWVTDLSQTIMIKEMSCALVELCPKVGDGLIRRLVEVA